MTTKYDKRVRNKSSYIFFSIARYQMFEVLKNIIKTQNKKIANQWTHRLEIFEWTNEKRLSMAFTSGHHNTFILIK